MRSAPIEMTIDTSVSRSAPVSPPGNLGQGVDRRRQRLGLAGNVGDEGDGRAEFAHRLGEAQDHAGDDPRQDQRQGDEQEHPERVGAERAGGVFQAAIDGLDRQADRPDQQRKGHHRAGERRAGPAKREHDPEMLVQERADRAAPSEAEEEQIAGDDRRQDERQQHDAVDDRLSGEVRARQQVGDRDADRQAGEHRDGCDPDAEPNRGPLVRREVEQIVHAIRSPLSSRADQTVKSAGRPAPSTVKPWRSKIGRAPADRMKFRNASASGLVESFVSAIG